MLGPPVDALYLWVGLAVVSLVFLGVAVGTPTVPPPDAASLANTVDAVSASRYPTRAAHPTSSSAVRVGPHRVSLRNDGGTTHAVLAFGPVTPVAEEDSLARVLRGEPPSHVFERPASFRRATERARNRTPRWGPARDRILVRRVSWEGIDVTLVG